MSEPADDHWISDALIEAVLGGLDDDPAAPPDPATTDGAGADVTPPAATELAPDVPTRAEPTSVAPTPPTPEAIPSPPEAMPPTPEAMPPTPDVIPVAPDQALPGEPPTLDGPRYRPFDHAAGDPAASPAVRPTTPTPEVTPEPIGFDIGSELHLERRAEPTQSVVGYGTAGAEAGIDEVAPEEAPEIVPEPITPTAGPARLFPGLDDGPVPPGPMRDEPADPAPLQPPPSTEADRFVSQAPPGTTPTNSPVPSVFPSASVDPVTPDEPPTPDAPARRHAPFAADGDLDRPLVDPLTRTEIPAPDTEPERFAAGGTMPEIDDTTLPSSNAAAEHGSIDEAVGADHTGTADLTGNDPVGTPPSDAAKPVTSPDTPAVVEPAIEAQPTPNEPAATTESSSSDATDRPAETSGAGGGDRSLGELAEGELEEFEDHPSGFRILVEWIAVFAGAFLVALILRAFVVQSFFIPSESMESTLTENDRVLVNKLSYRLGDVNRGDVIVFRRDPNTPGDTDDLIKRVIGLPGESVEIRAGAVYINGQLLDEPYLDADVVLDDFPATDVPEDEFFVMGDNRDQSFDSRWIGPVPRERIVGRAFVLFWPLNRADAL